MEKGCSRLSSDLEIGTSHSLASRLPYNPERDSCSPLTRGGNPQADSVRSSRAGLMKRQTRQVRTMRYQEIDPGRRDEWTT
jgi:hypothetical protein